MNTNATKELVLGAMTKDNVNWTWIGGSDLEEEGVWKWTDCTPWEDMFWAPGEPNNYGNNEGCLVQWQESSERNPKQWNLWNDDVCSKETKFLCRKKICSGNNINGKNFCTIWNCSSIILKL